MAVTTTRFAGPSRRLAGDDLDRSAAEPELLREQVALGEGLVAGRCDVEDAVLDAGPSVGDALADPLRLVRLDVDDRGGPASGISNCGFSIARRFLGWPVPVGERLRRRPRRVREHARLIGHAPGVGEGPIERDIALVEVRGHGTDRRAARQRGQPCPCGIRPMSPSSPLVCETLTSRSQTP